MEKERKRQLNLKFWDIKNKEEALYVIKQASYGFLFIGILHIILGFFIDIGTIIDGAIYLFLGLLLLFLKSRIISIILLILSGIGIVATFLNYVGVTYGGKNILSAIIVFYVAIASTYATFKYHSLNKNS